MVNKRSSGGHPYYKKKIDLEDIASKTFNSIINESFDLEIFTRPCVVHRVLQPGSDEIKNRWIYCVPIEITILEMYFGLKVVDFFQNRDDIPIKLGSTQKELHSFIMKSKTGKFSSAGDYSKFDSTLPKHIIYTSFHIIKSMLSLSSYECKLFDAMTAFVVESNIYHPHTGFVIRGRGIISGSYYTNLVDSIAN